MKIAVVGTRGFVGRHLLHHLEARHIECSALSRADLAPDQIVAALSHCDILVNCAGRKRGGAVAEDDNVVLPQRLYKAAVNARLRQFVHVSSVAAIASVTPPGVVLGDDTAPSPDTAYGASKLAGDRGLLENVSGTVTLTILRPPILVGADAGGIFRLLRHAARVGLPLPLAGLQNRRSLMHVDNFAEAIVAAAQANCEGAFITVDSHPMTPGDIYRQMTRSTGDPQRLLEIGAKGQSMLRRMLGQRSSSLLDDAVFDGSRFATRTSVQWPVPADRILPSVMDP